LDEVDADVFVNVQGDEPILDPKDLTKILEEAVKGETDVINGYSEITVPEQFFSRTVPKVVFKANGELTYMSRNPIPINKHGEFKKAWRQICIYSFSRKALELYGPGKTKTMLEEIEDIEILRMLENGVSVKMVELSGVSLAVDVPEDVFRVENILKERGEVN